MRCCFNFGGIIQFWHCIFALGFQICVLIRSYLAYLKLRTQIYNARHGLDWDSTPLHIFINCTVTSSVFTIVMAFLLCAHKDDAFLGYFPTNYSQRSLYNRSSRNSENINQGAMSIYPDPKKRTKTQGNYYNIVFPLAFLFHTFAAYCLIIPMPWVIGEQAKHEAITPSLVWQTDLSIIFPVLSPKDVIKNTRERHPELVAKLASSGVLSTRLTGSTLLAIQPPALGGIGQPPQTEHQENAVADLKTALFQPSSDSSTDAINTAIESHSFRNPSPEIVNFFLALAFLAIRIATDFWTTWPVFAYISSILLILTSVYLTIDYAAISLLIQLTVCLTPSNNSSDIYGSLVMVRLPMRLKPWILICSTAAAYVITLGSIVTLFYLGVSQFYKVCQENYYTVTNLVDLMERPFRETLDREVTPTPHWTDTSSSEIGSLRRRTQNRCCLFSRDCHFLVLGFSTFFIGIFLRLPYIYDIFQLYVNENDYLCLTTVMFFVCIHLCWFMVWFGFAMKQKWTLRVKYSLKAQPSQLSYHEPGLSTIYSEGVPFQGSRKLPEMLEYGEEVPIAVSNPNPAYIYLSPVQLQNLGAMNRSPILVPPKLSQPPATIFQRPQRTSSLQEPGACRIMTNALYEPTSVSLKATTPEGGSFLLPSSYKQTSTQHKYTSLQRPTLWNTAMSGKQEVIVNVTESTPKFSVVLQPSTVSSETTGNKDNEALPLALLTGNEVINHLKLAPIAAQESCHSAASSADDQICSQV